MPRTKKTSADKKRKVERAKKRIQRKNETSEQTVKRRLKDRENKTINREAETEDQTAKRRLTVQRTMASLREAETEEQTAKRRLTVQRTMASLREAETEEQTAKRRLKDRENKSLNREAETEEQHNLRKQTQKKRTTEHRKACSANITDVTRHFQEKVKIGPDFVCISCHRMLYRDVVQLYKKEQYMKLPNEKDNAGKQKESQKKNTEMMNILHAIEPFLYTSNDGNLWICKTCHRALQRCRIPSQSLANGLALDKVPKELSKLNNIEVRLLSQRIPFMKIVALPSGRQKAIHGPAINVVSNIDTICTILPRLPKQLEFIPMKLKRKLIYKSYYMFDSVNIQSMTDALGWLKQNNSLYSDIRINYNWKQQSIDEDQELWEALSRLTVENEPGAEIKSKKSKSCNPSKSKVSEDLRVQLVVRPKVPSVIVDSCAEFDLLFKKMGYFVENVVGDGNCFFHAIVKQAEQYGMHNQYHKNYSRLRTDIADYLEAHPNGPAGNLPYRNFLVDRTEPHVKGDVEPACSVMDNYVEQVCDETERQELRWQRDWTIVPHLGGTPEDLTTANTLRDTWKDQGLDPVEVSSYDVLLSYPDKEDLNVIQLLDESDDVIYESQRIEKILTPDQDHPDVVPPFNAYSPTGDVEGPLVYVNYGRIEDFLYLKNRSIDLNGTIAIARYGRLFRGDKVKFAYEHGCIGMILYTDPADYTIPDENTVYPDSWWLPPTGVQRGTVFPGDGDPITPGYPSIKSAYRVQESTIDLPKIPAHPIGYGDAEMFLRNMTGEEVPEDWRGGLDITYRFGIGFNNPQWKAKMHITTHNRNTTTYNVFGYLRGDVEPDRYVLLGNHRDAWVFGALDPTSGTASMIELSRVLGHLYQQGWRPRRTIVFCSWGAEEYALVGS